MERGRGGGGGGGNRDFRPFRGRGAFRGGGRGMYRGFHRETLGRRYDQDSVRRRRNYDRNKEEDDLTAKFCNQVEQISILLSMDEHDSVQRTVYSKPHDRFSARNSEINVLNERMQRQSLSDPDCLGRTARRPVFNREFQGHTQDSSGSGFKSRSTCGNTVRESSSGLRSRGRGFHSDFGGRERTYRSSRTREKRDDSRDRVRQVDKGRKQRASWIPDGVPAVGSDTKKTPGNRRGDMLDTRKCDQETKSGSTELGRHWRKIQDSPKIMQDLRKETATHEKSNVDSDKTQPENNKGIDLELSDISSEESDEPRNNSSNVHVEAEGRRTHLVESEEEGIGRPSRSCHGHSINMLNRSSERYGSDRRARLPRDSDISIQGHISRRDAHACHRRPSSLERDQEWIQKLGRSLSEEICLGHTREIPRQRQKDSYRAEYSSKEREASLLGKWIEQRTPATSSSPEKSDCDIQRQVALQKGPTSSEGADICRQEDEVIAASSSRQRGEQEDIDVSVKPRGKKDTHEERENTDKSFKSRDRKERYHGICETMDGFGSQEVEETYLESHEILEGTCPKEECKFAIGENVLDSQAKHHGDRVPRVESSSSSGKEDEYCSMKEKTEDIFSSVERKNRPRQYRIKRAEISNSGERDDKFLGDQAKPEESSSSSKRKERCSGKHKNSIASSGSSERQERYPGEQKMRLETSSSSESEDGYGREQEEKSTSSEDSHRREYATGTSSSSENDTRYSDSESSSFVNSDAAQRRHRKRLRSSTPQSDYRRPTQRSRSRSKGSRFRDRTSDDRRSRSRSFGSSDSEVEKRGLPVRQTSPKVQFGYGRHVFSSLSESNRSRSRSVSMARSKIQFYDRFNYRSRMCAKEKLFRKEQERKKAAAWRSILEAELTEEKDNVCSTSLVEATESLQISVKSVSSIKLSGCTESLKKQDSKLKDNSPRKHCLSQEQSVLKQDCKSALSTSSKQGRENTTLQQSPVSSSQSHTIHSEGVNKKTISPGKELAQITSPSKKSLFLQGVTSASSIMRLVRPPVSAQKKSFWNDVQQSRRRPLKEYTPLKKSTDVVKPSPSTSSSFEEVITEPVKDSFQAGSDKSLPPSSKLLQKGPKSSNCTKPEGDDDGVSNAGGQEPLMPVSEDTKTLNKNYPNSTLESSGSFALTQQDVWNIPLPKSSPIKSTDLKPRVIQLPVFLRSKSANAKQIYKEVELKDVTIKPSTSSEFKSELHSASVFNTDLKSEMKVESPFIRLSTSDCLSDHEEVDMDLDDEDDEHKISLEEDTSWMSSGTDQRIISEGSSTSTKYSSVPLPISQILTTAKRSPDKSQGSVQLGVTFPDQLPNTSSQRLSGIELQSPPKPVTTAEEQSIIPQGQNETNSKANLSFTKSALETEVPQGVQAAGELQKNVVPKVSFKLPQSRVPLLVHPAQLSPPASPPRSSETSQPLEIGSFTPHMKCPTVKVQASSYAPTSQPVETSVSKSSPDTASMQYSVTSPKESPTTISLRSTSDSQQGILSLPVPLLQLMPIPSFKFSNLQQITMSQTSPVSTSLLSSLPQPVPPPHQSPTTSPNLLSSGFKQTSQPKPVPPPYPSPIASRQGHASGFLQTSHSQVVMPPHHTPISPPGTNGSLQISQPRPVPPPLQSPPASSQCLSGNFLPNYVPLPVPPSQEVPGTPSKSLMDIFSQTSVREPAPQPVPPPELSPKTSQGLSIIHNMIPLPVPPPQQSPATSSQLLSSSCLPAPVPQAVPLPEQSLISDKQPVSPSLTTSPTSNMSNQKTTKTSSLTPVDGSGHNAKTQQASQSKYLRQLKTVLRKSMSKLADAVPKQSSRSVTKHESKPEFKSTPVNPDEDYDSEEYDAPSPYSSSSGSPMDIEATEESKIEVFQPFTKQDLPIQDTAKFVSSCQTASAVPQSTIPSDVSRTSDMPKTLDTMKTADTLNMPGCGTPQSVVKKSRDPRLQARAKKQEEARAGLVIKDVVTTVSRPPETSASKMEPKPKTVAMVTGSQSCGRSSPDTLIGSGSMSHPCGIVSSSGRSVSQNEDHKQYSSRSSEAISSRPQSFENLTDGGYWGIPPDLDEGAGYTSDGNGADHRPTLSRSLSVGCPVGQARNTAVESRDDVSRHLQDVTKSVAHCQSGKVTRRYSVPSARSVENRGKEDEDFRTKDSNSSSQIPGVRPKSPLQGDTDVHRAKSDLEDKLLLVNTKKQGATSKRPVLVREGSAGGSSVCTDLSTKGFLGTKESQKPESDQSDDHRRKGPTASPKESSPNQVERSPVSVMASPQGSALKLIPLGTESRESLFSEKVRGMSHKDISDWVKKSSNQQQLDLETDQWYSTKPMKKHIDGEKRRHHSSPNSKSYTSSPKSSEGGRHRNESGTKGDVKDRNKIRSSQSLGKTVKNPKADIRRFLSQDASPRNKDGTRTMDYASEDSYEIPEPMDVDTSETVRQPSKSKMVLDSLRLSKFKANLVKSPAFKAKPSATSTSSAMSESPGSCRPTQTPLRRTTDVGNALGSYRIPKLTSAVSETVVKEAEEEKSEAPKKEEDDLSKLEAGSDSGQESDDDLFNETPAFLKEFEKTSKAILEAGMRPGTPEPTQSESMLNDDSFLMETAGVSCSTKPSVTRTAEAKSAFSLDALLAEKVENEEADRELHLMQNQLKEGIRQGGFIKVAEADVDDSEDDLLPEHQQKLEYFQVSESTIQDHHPGDLVFHPGTFPCVFSEALSPSRCGFLPSNNFLEKHLANIAPDVLCDLLTTDMLSICFHKITRQEEILQWIFYIMSVHRNSQVIQGCKKLLFDIIHTQLRLEDASYSWAPAALDVLKVFVNFGACSADLLPDQDLFSQEEIRTCVTPEDDSNLAPDNNNVPMRSYSENLREVLQTMAFALQGRPKYSASQLSAILLMTAKAALDKEFNDNKLLYEFSVLISSILPCYTQQDWNAAMPTLCLRLSCITSHHHNHVYLTQLFPYGKRGSSIQRRLAYVLLVKILSRDTVSHQQLATFKLNQLTVLFPALRELATDDLYALASGVALLDIAVGSEPLNSEEKDYLQVLMEQLRTLTSDVRDNVRRLDHTRVKDLMVRISSKWTVTLQATSSKQRSLFAWTKQKSPQKMQVQRLETGSSDQDSEEEDQDPVVPDPSDKQDDMSVPMETDTCLDSDSKFQEVSHTVVPRDAIVSCMEGSGKLDTVNSKGHGDSVESGDMKLKSVQSGLKQKKDSTLNIGNGDGAHFVDGDKSCLEATLPGLEMNQNNNALDVSDHGAHRHIKVESQVRVVLTDIVTKEYEDTEISSGDESLPELDIV
ncbi:mucin-4-like [Haliotis asinina]|uniref:mucin-4-like n=1 Tax=Haliotis asinina TaxID=109174 RepID=UPI003531E72F